MFVVVEGIDLVGKTTQHELLVRYLRARGRDVSSYSFPAYDSPTGLVIREHLRGEVALTGMVETLVGTTMVSPHDSLVLQCLQVVDKYAAAPEIARSLREGRDVACCRWWQSAHAYGLESSLDRDWMARTCKLLPRADVNILLDLDPARARRRPGASPDRLEADLALQERVRRRYLDLWTGRESVQEVIENWNMTSMTVRNSWTNLNRDTGERGYWAVVDAGGGVGAVHERVLSALEASGVLTGGGSGRVGSSDGHSGPEVPR